MSTSPVRPPAPGLPPGMVPRLRGVLHAWAAWFALAAAVALVVLAPTASARLATIVYGTGLCALFACSALYHRWRGNPRWVPMLRRIDHSTIFVFIAASYTPIAVLVLSPPVRTVVLVLAWGTALAGVAFSVAWITAPRVLVAATYAGVGWVMVIAAPELLSRLPTVPLVLLMVGGLLYSLGAAVYAARRPNPWPRVFGFHELFHALVIAAAASQFAAMAGWIVPGAGA